MTENCDLGLAVFIQQNQLFKGRCTAEQIEVGALMSDMSKHRQQNLG
jgi:hypothetical protein